MKKSKLYVFSILTILTVKMANGLSQSPEPTPSSFDPGLDTRNRVAIPRRSRLSRDESEERSDRRQVFLTVGENKTVDIDVATYPEESKALTIGNPKVLETQLVLIGNNRRQVVFKPLAVGDTNVSVRDADGNLKMIFDVRVTNTNLGRLAGEILDLLQDVEGIEVKIVGTKVIVDGEVLTPQDFGRVGAILLDPAYKDSVLSLVTLSPMSLQILANKLRGEFNKLKPQLEKVTTRVVNNVILVEGKVMPPKMEAEKAIKDIVQLYLPYAIPAPVVERADSKELGGLLKRPIGEPVLIRITEELPPPPPPMEPMKPLEPPKRDPMLKLVFHFVQMAKDYNKVFGFKWAPEFSADPSITFGNGQNSTPSFAGTITSLIPRLANAQTAGFARVLRTVTVLGKMGEQAEFSHRTQIPVLQFETQGGTTRTASVPVNVKTNAQVIPTFHKPDDLQRQAFELKVNLVQESVDGKTTRGEPIISSYTLQNTVIVQHGESAAIAAFNSTDAGTDFNKDTPWYTTQGGSSSPSDPMNGAAPSGGSPSQPIVNLSHSKSYRKKRGQYVIFVTPELVETAENALADYKKNIRVKVK